MGLTAFRLRDVPLDLRLQAAARLARQASSKLPDDQVAPTDRLFARLLSNAQHDTDTIRRQAEHPSDRVYWIPTPAWESVMHPKNRRTC